jgi:prepilin-type N-terminal cleavage/methylation domain-containing protein
MSGSRAIRRRIGDERGVTITEMLVVLLILAIVLGGMTTLFVSAGTSQVDQTNRVLAQQEARLALDSLRREIHCAKEVVVGSTPASSIRITLGSYCPTYKASEPSVTWCARTVVASTRYALVRFGTAPTPGTCPAGGVKRADYLTTATIFTSYVAPAGGNLGTLAVMLPVDVSPADAKQRFTLRDDIVLRNSGRG